MDLYISPSLTSQEILVSDTRYAKEPANRRGNVFSHIVQPMPEQRHSVQAEVHARYVGVGLPSSSSMIVSSLEKMNSIIK